MESNVRDLSLLQAVQKKENYDSIVPNLPDSTTDRYTRQVLKDIGEYYEQTNNDKLDIDDFAFWFFNVQHRTAKEEFQTIYSRLFERWEAAEYKENDVQVLLNEYSRINFFNRLRSLSMDALEGNYDIDKEKILEEIHSYETHSVSDNPDELSEYEVSSDLNEIMEQEDYDGIELEWRLEGLNVSCGPLRRGNFIEVAAYVDSGKTSFLASEATYMASQLDPDDYVVWINNEEAGNNVRQRLYAATLGVPYKFFGTDPVAYTAEYHRILGRNNRIRLLDKPAADYRYYELELSRIKPKLIIIDMLDKIHGFDQEKRDDLRLQKLYQWARELAKIYGPVIASTQVDGTGSNKEFISMTQLAGSRVAKQGEADAIITIGRLEDEDKGHEARRYIFVPKNKLRGGERSEESERNGKWISYIQPEIARFVMA